MAEDQERARRFESEALPHLDALHRTALRLAGNRSDAEDLLQETYLRAWRFFDRYTPGTNCKAWLFRILTNTAMNAFGKRARQPARVAFEDVETMLASPDPIEQAPPTAGDVAALDGLLDDEVQAALHAVPETFRVVVVLALVEGLAYREIADVLEIPIGTVMSRLHRGRRLLRAALGDTARRRGLVKD